MKRCLLHLIGGLACLNAGCGILIDATRNAINEPCLAWNNLKFDCRCEKLAKAAWKGFAACHQDMKYTKYFAEGFRDGYADYLRRGGSGEPPSAPPKCYRKMCHANYAGYLAAEEYFAGWRVGAEQAIMSGQRQLFVVPVLVPAKEETAYNPAFAPPPGSPPPAETPPLQLAAPRKVAAAPKALNGPMP